MNEVEIFAEQVFTIGPIVITQTVVTTWGIMALLWLGCWLFVRTIQQQPGSLQTAIEGIVTVIEKAIANVAPPPISKMWFVLPMPK